MQNKQQDSGGEGMSRRLLNQREKLGWGFWKIYAYWAWRTLLFLLFIAVVVNLDIDDGLFGLFDHISGLEWAAVLFLAILGPALFAGWSYVWMWCTNLLNRLRR